MSLLSASVEPTTDQAGLACNGSASICADSVMSIRSSCYKAVPRRYAVPANSVPRPWARVNFGVHNLGVALPNQVTCKLKVILGRNDKSRGVTNLPRVFMLNQLSCEQNRRERAVESGQFLPILSVIAKNIMVGDIGRLTHVPRSLMIPDLSHMWLGAWTVTGLSDVTNGVGVGFRPNIQIESRIFSASSFSIRSSRTRRQW